MKYLVFCFALCFASVGVAELNDASIPTPIQGEQLRPTESATNANLPIPAPKTNPEATTYLVLGVVGFLALTGIGTAMGANGTLVIYKNWFDFCLSVGLPVLAFIQNHYVHVLTCSLLGLSIVLSFQANRNLLKLILVLPAKFGLPILTLLAGFLALGSVSSLLRGKIEVNKETVKNAVVGTICAAGFLYLTKLIKRLIEPQEPALLEDSQPNQENT